VTSAPTALLTFSIGPVHTFIGQARRIADLWAGSAILSDVTTTAMEALLAIEGTDLIFPNTRTPRELAGVPNRFVARVPGNDPGAIAGIVDAAVLNRWEAIVAHAKATVIEKAQAGADTAADIESAPWSEALTTAWSWVVEEGDYRTSSEEGARLFAASRVYRPFRPASEAGVKCAICGERNALPDGKRGRVEAFWLAAERLTDKTPFERYFRYKQTRLCLVCTAKRLYPTLDGGAKKALFESFEDFQPSDDNPYFAVVTMDGDSLGDRLSGDRAGDGGLEAYQRKVSGVLSEFAKTLRTKGAELNLASLGIQPADDKHRPQLIYAGGEDVLFVSDPRDALPVTAAIRELYQKMFSDEELPADDFTISAAVLFAHTSTPAGLLFKDAEHLLKSKAKAGEKNAIAVRLQKGSGTPVEVALPWDGPWLEGLGKLQYALRGRQLASRQTYDLAEADRALHHVFTDPAQWHGWLLYRLGQGELSAESASELAKLLQPFFEEQKTEALRIARFLAIEAGRTKEGAA
jgi:hypothetical protein